jgi:hypothetical protein
MDANGIIATGFFKPIKKFDVVTAVKRPITSIMVDVN